MVSISTKMIEASRRGEANVRDPNEKCAIPIDSGAPPRPPKRMLHGVLREYHILLRQQVILMMTPMTATAASTTHSSSISSHANVGVNKRKSRACCVFEQTRKSKSPQ